MWTKEEQYIFTIKLLFWGAQSFFFLSSFLVMEESNDSLQKIEIKNLNILILIFKNLGKHPLSD